MERTALSDAAPRRIQWLHQFHRLQAIGVSSIPAPFRCSSLEGRVFGSTMSMVLSWSGYVSNGGFRASKR